MALDVSFPFLTLSWAVFVQGLPERMPSFRSTFPAAVGAGWRAAPPVVCHSFSLLPCRKPFGITLEFPRHRDWP